MRSLAVKRAIDITGAIVGLVLMAIPMVVIAVTILVTMDRPVIFRQVRAGFRGHAFTLYKFRTMSDLRDESGNLLPDEVRLTPVGRFLRKTSLDELPELVNVLRGEMSLVGPRPLRMDYLELYSPEQARRHLVKPGVTGWAQINGRNAIPWEEKFRLDVWYVDNWSTVLDLRIIVRTFVDVLARRGINAAGYATMPPFAGARDQDGQWSAMGRVHR
ncbi:MAG: sugar transferase [Bacillota bacterium]